MKSICKCDAYYTCKSCRIAEGATYQEIANDLGISHQAVWGIEKRAYEDVELQGITLEQYNALIGYLTRNIK